MRSACGALVLLVVLGCGNDDTPDAPHSSAQMAGDFIDLDPDPGRVRVELVAGPAEVEILAGRTTPMWAYRDGAKTGARGSVPGPVLDVREGQSIEVEFENQLDIETTVHWHGLRLAASMDGSNVSQRPILPGETFTYRFVARDPGSFWYHPHLEADTQIEAGLQGPIVVRGGTELDVSGERLFVIDDIKIESNGARSSLITQLDLMVGRQGNVRLVNGKQAPVALEMPAGARERWRFVNSANGHFFNLVLPGTKLLVVGWDGGLVSQPYEVDALLIAPGERYEVLVAPKAAPGDTIALQDVHYNRGHNLPDEGPKDLVTFTIGEPLDRPLRALPETWRDFRPIDTTGTLTRTFTLTERMNEGDPRGEPEFFINSEKWPAVTPIAVRFGATEIWQITNDSEMDHPVHLHGMFFQVLDLRGVSVPAIGLKDTLIVPQRSSARIAVTYDAPGDWMYHCHILEHAERGMMGHLHVLE